MVLVEARFSCIKSHFSDINDGAYLTLNVGQEFERHQEIQKDRQKTEEN